MLITNRTKPLVATKDIDCFKVMVKIKNNQYVVCPPAIINYILTKYPYNIYSLGQLISEEETIDPLKDYRIDVPKFNAKGIGPGFLHTFQNIESAETFKKFLEERIKYPSGNHPELYKMPFPGSKLVILRARIPKGSLYYKGGYAEVSNEKTYASNKLIYISEYMPGFRQKDFSKNSIIGSTVNIVMDRPIGYVHHGHKYPVNYGYVPGLIGGDGEEQDVYLLGIDKPLKEYKGAKIIAIIHRLNDNEDKWVACPKNMNFSKEEILEKVNFMEQYFKITIEI